MPLPWRLNKRMITREDNDAKNSTSNYVSHSNTQTYARKPSHESESNLHEVKKSNCVPPKGIIFNYNIQKRSTHTTNENKSVTKENENDNHTTIIESNAENNDNSGIDDSNIKPNKMYKIVIVDGNIRLAEYDDDDIIEENDEGNKDESDSDVEFIDTDDHLEVNKNNNCSLRKYEIIKEVNTGPEDETNLTPIKPMALTKPMPIVSNQHDNCTVPNILNHNLQSVPPKTYTRRKDNVSFMSMAKLASINGQNSSKNNIHTTKKNLAEARSGKAMVLLPLQKYTSLKKKLADIQKEKEIWIELETKYKKEKIEAEQRVVKKNTIGVQTGKCHSEELEELNLLKARLAKMFTEAQINMISNSKKLRDIVWSDSEMEKVVFLKQIISQTAYVFLKYKMRFPLPPLSAVKQWMIKKNIYVKPSRKEKIQKPAKTNTRMVGEELNLDNTQIPLPLEPLNSNVHNETQGIHTLQTQTVSETADAVNSIIDDQRPQDVEFGSTLQVYSTLSGPTDAGEQFVYYSYENVNNENDGDDANYLPDDNISTVEEIVHSEVVRPPKKTVAEATLRCRLCMRPFDTDQEVRQHVPLHYYNTYYTSYLDAVKPFVCEFCNESVKHRFDLVHHHRIHLGINSLKCWFPGCTYIGKNVGSLKSHHDSHRARSCRCAECGALFKTRKSLRQHVARRHAARALLRCALCRATCLTLYTYRKHMDSHQRPPRIKCVEAGCGESFYSRASLRKHVSDAHRVTARPYRCGRCPRAHYALEAQLNRHLQKHETHKISHCVKCLKVFYDYGEFYTHYMEHKDSEHKCKCTCGQKFFTQEELDEHKLQCTFVSGDNTKKNKKRKRKDKNAENTDQTDTTINGQTKRRRTIKVKTCSTEQNSVVNEKSYERNITVEQENNEKQVSEENQTFEQDQQERISAEPVISEDIKEKVITLQIKNNQAVIKLANTYPNITNNYMQVVSTTDRQLQKYIVIPKRDQKVLTKSALQQKVIANVGSQQQKVIANVGSQQQKVIANVGSQQQKVIANVGSQQQKVIANVGSQQQKVITNVGSQKQKVITNAGSQQENFFSVSDNQARKVITVPDNHFQKLIVMPKKYQHNVNSISENVGRNVISVPENNLQKVFVVSNEQRNNISQENNSTPPGNQNNIVQVSPNEHKIKNLLTENKGHCPKKLTPIAKGSVLEKTIAMSTIDKIISGPQGNYIKKVLALPIDSPLKKIITESENPGTESYNPVNRIIGDQDPFQTVTTDHESHVMEVTSDYEISVVPKSSLITHHEGRTKNVKAAPESPLKKVIAIPEMQCQNKLIPICNKNNQKILNSIPIENQVKKVINSNKLVVQIPGTRKLHRVTGITRQQLVAALANRPKKLISISNSINNNHTTKDNQVQESADQPDMPILDY
ncbi:unnamed protein product [Arctia plantaginis]|uniref:C2H2-type domain-containing protein n=1 Tax=Arctia plantaginis TaxID=874455 RepID=A0A8S1B5X2_ARCPL|nr:unnamed protein product [Arctia plantaginis]